MPSRYRKTTIAAMLALALAVCACSPRTHPPEISQADIDIEARTQKALVIRERIGLLERLQRVAWRVRLSNADLCGETVAPSLGMLALSRDDFSKNLQDGCLDADMHERPRVVFVAKGGPADLAGIKVGDMLYAVNGEEAESGKKAREALHDLKPEERVSLAVKRKGPDGSEGEVAEHLITPVKICNYPVVLELDREINAHADGRKIVVNSGIMEFLPSDDDLAAIIGHEMAHNTQLHMRDQRVNMLLGQLLVDLPAAVFGFRTNVGAYAGSMVYSQSYEREADYVGLYYTARAGYDVTDVAGMWRRLASGNPGGITKGYTHPPTAERYVAINAARDEIKAKQKAGLPLMPEMKDAGPADKAQ
jgi:hypothetical protein